MEFLKNSLLSFHKFCFHGDRRFTNNKPIETVIYRGKEIYEARRYPNAAVFDQMPIKMTLKNSPSHFHRLCTSVLHFPYSLYG